MLNIYGFCVLSAYLLVVAHEISVFQGFEYIYLGFCFGSISLLGTFEFLLANALTFYSMFIGFPFQFVGKRELLDLEI